MAKGESSYRVARFEGFELDLRVGELCRNGDKPVSLAEQPFRILAMLLERPGDLVTREEIRDALWPNGTIVEFEHSISAAINRLRQVLGDSAEESRFIETLARRGYRWRVGVEWVEKPRVSGTEDRTAPLEAGANQQPEAEAPPAQISRAKIGVVARRLLIALASCAILTLVVALARPVVPTPRVTGVHQITHIGTIVSNQNLLVSGSRIYFMDGAGGHYQIRYVSLGDGAVFSVDEPFPIIGLHDIAPSGKELLVTEMVHGFPHGAWTRALWRLPLPSGPPRRVGNIFVDDASWSPDGRAIVYASEPDHSLNLVDADGSNVRKLATLPGRPFKLRWSPDGRLIRTSVNDPEGDGISLWQLDASRRNVTRMLPDGSSSSRAWAGRWTRDASYFLFTEAQGLKRNIWALRDKRDLLRRNTTQPVQLTDGPINFYLPVPSDDGKTIYAVGIQQHGQLMGYNARSGQYEPYAGGLSIDHVAFSRDGKRMAYVTYPEGALVRSHLDGSERLQLTFGPMRALDLQWSPDGSQIAFDAGLYSGGPLKIYLVSANGSSPRLVVPGTGGDLSLCGWSPDGQSLLFASSDESGSGWEVYSVNLKTGKETMLPGTLGITGGSLSPDGRHLAGISVSTRNLVLYDMAAGTTRQLAELSGYPSWSRDGNYVYYSTLMDSFVLGPQKAAIYRVKVADSSIERVAPLPPFGLTGNWGWWSGLAPDGSILLLRELGMSDIYALDVDLP